jgi:hypothetical protein
MLSIMIANPDELKKHDLDYDMRTVDGIAELTTYLLKLSFSIRLGKTVEALIVGYNPDSALGSEPQFYIAKNDGSKPLRVTESSASVPISIQKILPTVFKSKGMIIPNKRTDYRDTERDADLFMLEISHIESIGALTSGHIGGKIRRWNITKSGIDPSFGGKLPVQIEKGQKL